MSRAAAEAYKTQAIMTASPAKLVAMCFDRSIGALQEAVRAIENGEIERRFTNVTRATDIVSHLWSTLDMDRGGEIAQNLSNIYSFALMRLPDVNLKNDAEAAKDVISVLQPLAQAWNALANRGESAGAAAAAAARAASAMTSPAPRPRPVRPTTQDAPVRAGIAISI